MKNSKTKVFFYKQETRERAWYEVREYILERARRDYRELKRGDIEISKLLDFRL